MKQSILVPMDQAWRLRYNPLSGFDIAKCVTLLAALNSGQFADVQWTFNNIMRRWPIFRAIVAKYTSAVLRMDWDVVPTTNKKADAKLAEAQVEALREAYERIDNMREAIRFLVLATFAGFSHLQKRYDATGEVNHFEPLDQWNWVRDGKRGTWYWNPEAQGLTAATLKGRPESNIVPEEFLIREVEFPVIDCALARYAYHILGVTDWASFVDIFGLPKPIVTMPEGVESDTQKAEFTTAVDLIAIGGTGTLPAGSVVTWPNQERIEPPFAQFLEENDAQLVIAATGSKLSMLEQTTASLGSGAASNVHQDTFSQLGEGEAADISELFQSQFDRAFLAKRFPGKPVLAYWKLQSKSEEDTTQTTTQVGQLTGAGYKLDPVQVEEKTGWRVELAPKPTVPMVPAVPEEDGKDATPGADGQPADQTQRDAQGTREVAA